MGVGAGMLCGLVIVVIGGLGFLWGSWFESRAWENRIDEASYRGWRIAAHRRHFDIRRVKYSNEVKN